MSTFKWTDEEAELLLQLTLDYKTEQTAQAIDFETVPTKYADLTSRFTAAIETNKTA